MQISPVEAVITQISLSLPFPEYKYISGTSWKGPQEIHPISPLS